MSANEFFIANSKSRDRILSVTVAVSLILRTLCVGRAGPRRLRLLGEIRIGHREVFRYGWKLWPTPDACRSLVIRSV